MVDLNKLATLTSVAVLACLIVTGPNEFIQTPDELLICILNWTM